MSTPTAKIDRRYSDPEAEATTWAEASRVLEDAQLAWLATVRPEGGPHVTPVVSVLAEGTVYFMTGPDEQKARNLAANPKVALTTGANTWDRGLDVVVEGTARLVTDDATLKVAADAWARTWDGRWTLAVKDGSIQHVVDGEPQDYGTIVYAIDPTVAYAHAKGTFAHTRFSY